MSNRLWDVVLSIVLLALVAIAAAAGTVAYIAWLLVEVFVFGPMRLAVWVSRGKILPPEVKEDHRHAN